MNWERVDMKSSTSSLASSSKTWCWIVRLAWDSSSSIRCCYISEVHSAVHLQVFSLLKLMGICNIWCRKLTPLCIFKFFHYWNWWGFAIYDVGSFLGFLLHWTSELNDVSWCAFIISVLIEGFLCRWNWIVDGIWKAYAHAGRIAILFQAMLFVGFPHIYHRSAYTFTEMPLLFLWLQRSMMVQRILKKAPR
jgi:hypothetical protein